MKSSHIKCLNQMCHRPSRHTVKYSTVVSMPLSNLVTRLLNFVSARAAAGATWIMRACAAMKHDSNVEWYSSVHTHVYSSTMLWNSSSWGRATRSWTRSAGRDSAVPCVCTAVHTHMCTRALRRDGKPILTLPAYLLQYCGLGRLR